MRPRVCVSLPGGASHVATLAGAARAIDEACDVVGWAGVSAGGLVAIAKAFGVDDARLREVLVKYLQSNRMLDATPLALVDGLIGVCHWEVIPRIVDDLIGEGKTLGEALTALVLVVTDADTGSPIYLSKRDTPRVLVREAARATAALVPLAPMVEIPSLGWRQGGLFFDGGFTDNTCDAVWDDRSEPRIAVRLGDGAIGHTVARGDLVGQSLAILRALMHSEGKLQSTREDGWSVVVSANGDGLDFSLTPTQILLRDRTGYDDARAMLARRLRGM